MICVRFASDLRQKKLPIFCEYSKLFIASFILIISILLIGIVVAESSQSQDGLEAELSNLTAELTSEGYDWLVNYSEDDLYQTASIEVYTQDNDTLITKFTNISKEGWYRVLLVNLIGSYSTFDLKIIGSDEIKIPYNIFQKKKRVDEIRGMLSKERRLLS